MKNLDRYIENLKASLNEKVFSPVFIRLANVYFLNKQYEACIQVCRTGLHIYPYYLTPKILLIRSYIKLGHLNEAEKLFNEIESKIIDVPVYKKIKEGILKLRQEPGQERILYNFYKKPNLRFEDNKDAILALIGKHKLKNIKKDKLKDLSVLEEETDPKRLEVLRDKFSETTLKQTYEDKQKELKEEIENEELFGRIKIVTETLADIYAQQGNFKEAFNAYNILLRAGTPNKKRIESKLFELERISFKTDEN